MTDWEPNQADCHRKYEEICLGPKTKDLKPIEMSNGQSDKDKKNATKKIDNTAIVDRIRTVSWSSHSYQTGVVNRFIGSTFPLPQRPCSQKDTHNTFLNKSSYIENTHTKPGGHKLDTKTAYVINIVHFEYKKKYIYTDIRIGQAVFRSAGSELRSYGWMSTD